MRKAYIGNAAGFAADRMDAGMPVLEALIAADGPAALCYETLAERTLALAQRERHQDPDLGYTPDLVGFLAPVLRRAVECGIPIIGNFGAANPRGAALRIHRLARELGVAGLRIAVVEGDDVRGRLSELGIVAWEEEPLPTAANAGILAANVYFGARPIAEALALEPHVVVTGRVTDSALALGPLIHWFGWAADDWDRLAAGVLAGHILECGAQVTGGYYADPGYKEVPGMAEIGYPITEVAEDGTIVVTKPPGTGGVVTPGTVKEQILYEIGDPSAYLTPDVTLDLTEVEVVEIGADLVRVRGARGRPAPPTLKVTVCVDGGWLGEGEISYAGPNALARARLAADTVEERIRRLGLDCALRSDLIGVVSVFDGDSAELRARRAEDGQYDDVRVRIAVQAADREVAARAVREVEALYCAGPAGGGGVRRGLVWRVRTSSCLVPREAVRPVVELVTDDERE